MKHLEHFSGLKPTKEDFHFERDAKEAAIKDHILDLTGNAVGGSGILKGIENEIQVNVDNPAQFLTCKVKTGAAYIRGEKVAIAEVQTVNLTDVETEANIIWLKYKLIDSSDPNAVRNHYLTGQPYIVWKVDSFELGATKESQYVQSINELKLARVAKVSGQLAVTNDYRLFLKFNPYCWPNYTQDSDFYVGGPAGTGRKVLVKQLAPSVPTRLTLSTGWDQIYRKNGEAAGLLSVRPAYIKVIFGDQGSGNASGYTFTWVSNRVGNWTTNEWANQYLTCADGNSWKVVSNTSDTLTLEATALPVNGIFWLGPLAAGYKFVLQILDPTDDTVQGTMEAEAAAAESPVKMEYIWHGLTPDIKYSVKVASRGGWFQDEWSAFSAAQTITAGGIKVIPDDCVNTVKNVAVAAEDDGIRISWDIDNAYVNDVAGLEIVWTDDGSEPNFDTLGHKKVYTDRRSIVIPSKHSTDTTNITVKAKLRAVDKAGRHCVTPVSITPTTAKKYLGNIDSFITEIKTARGTAASLNDRMSVSLEDSGKNKTITEVESEIADGRGTWATIGERIGAISQSQLDLDNVRIVAEGGAPFQSIVAAIQSLTESSKYKVIWIMPGVYTEDIVISEWPTGVNKVCLVGLGRVKIAGKFDSMAGDKFVLLQNLLVESNVSGALVRITGNASTYNYPSVVIDGCCLRQTGSNGRTLEAVGKTIVHNSYLYGSAEGMGVAHVKVNGSIKGRLAIINSKIESGGTTVHGLEMGMGDNTEMNAWLIDTIFKTTGYSVSDVGVGYGKALMAGCKYNSAPSVSLAQMVYGSLSNISNILFDAADLSGLLGDWV